MSDEPRWPAGVDPADYADLGGVKITFPPGDPLDQLAALPDLPDGTVMEYLDEVCIDYRPPPEWKYNP